MLKSRWPSWAPVLDKPTVSVDVKQHSTKTLYCVVVTTRSISVSTNIATRLLHTSIYTPAEIPRSFKPTLRGKLCNSGGLTVSPSRQSVEKGICTVCCQFWNCLRRRLGQSGVSMLQQDEGLGKGQASERPWQLPSVHVMEGALRLRAVSTCNMPLESGK